MLARKKALITGLILASGLSVVKSVVALDLGELVVESALAEPLDATIALEDVAGIDPTQISVSLGSAEDFVAAGIERSAEAAEVQFAVEVDGGEGSIHLTTAEPIEEPYLDVLLIVTWPDGTLQRDYTILMNIAGSTATTVGSLVIPGTTPADSPATSDTQTSQGNAATSSSGDGQTYTVADGDSMWEIAARTRPESGVSMHQMMLAIQRANEDAFINNNINRVLSGRVLRIPTLEEISLVDQNTAVAQVNQQNEQLSAQPLAVNRTTGNTSPAPEQDELTVLTEDQATAGSSGTGDLTSTIAALESEHMLSEENLDRARLENIELTGRFKMLEEELDLLQNLIAMEDARIAQLQADLAAQAETAEQAIATTEAATDVLAAQQTEPQAGVAGSVEGWLQNTAVLMSVIVGLLLLVLGYLFWQRRRMDAAVYAFDSGIPELETVENSTFAPAKKSGGLAGLFSGLGNKAANKAGDPVFADIDSAETGSAYARTATSAADGMRSHDAVDVTGDDFYHDHAGAEHSADASSRTYTFGASVDEDISRSSVAAESGSAAASGAGDRTISMVDEAELADELIAEARQADDYTQARVDADASSEAEREAHELAELMAPDAATTESTIPESFEFTLKTAPEALAEEATVESSDDIESFDFQLTDSDADPASPGSAKASGSQTTTDDDDAGMNALLLDDDEPGFQSSAPMNECDTKLDLAVAYEAMGDIDGAVEILEEVIADGDEAQVAEANRLKGLWRNS